jgi:hypothetical protein
VSNTADISRPANQFAAQHNYPQAEARLQRLVKIAERQNGPTESKSFSRFLTLVKSLSDDLIEALRSGAGGGATSSFHG